MEKKLDLSNLLCGGVFVLVGLFFALNSAELGIRSTSSFIGPGYFPLLVASALIVIGLAIGASGLGSADDQTSSAINWRGMLFILTGPIIFGFTVRGLGFVPALFVTAFLTSLASGRIGPVGAVGLAVVLTAFCAFVFGYALGLPYAPFGPWLSLRF